MWLDFRYVNLVEGNHSHAHGPFLGRPGRPRMYAWQRLLVRLRIHFQPPVCHNSDWLLDVLPLRSGAASGMRTRCAINSLEPMKFTFRFRGGSLDGQTVSGDTNDASSPARRYIFLTDQGSLGKRFREMPPERSEQIRRLLIPKDVDDAMKAAWQTATEGVNWLDPPNQDELVARYEAGLQELGVDISSCHPSYGEMMRISDQIEQITSQVYEVVARDDQPNESLVDVWFVGEDTVYRLAFCVARSTTA